MARSITVSSSFDSIIIEAEKRGLRVEAAGFGNTISISGPSGSARLLGTITHRTSHLAVRIAGNKQATKIMLSRAGLPVSPGSLVQTKQAALSIAADLGYPVTVKPNLGNQGTGVRNFLGDPAAVDSAYDAALSCNLGDVLVEKSCHGSDLRILVVNGSYVAASERFPSTIHGDGRKTIEELILSSNAASSSSSHLGLDLTSVAIDNDLLVDLSAKALDLKTVLPPGQVVKLREIASLSRGGVAVDRTDDVHSTLAALAVASADVVGLDIAGVDLICMDYRAPVGEADVVVLEVNASPGLRSHVYPISGISRNVAAQILDYLFSTP